MKVLARLLSRLDVARPDVARLADDIKPQDGRTPALHEVDQGDLKDAGEDLSASQTP